MAEVIGALQVALSASTAQFTADMGKARQSLGRFQKDMGAMRKDFASISQAIGGLAIFTTITKGFSDTTKAAVDFESAFAGVRKTVNESEAGFQQLISNFTDLSTTTPVSREELSRIGELAGQLGVSGVDNLTKFTETIARIAVSTNLTSEQAATNFAQFANVIQLPLDQVDRLGATIVALGNNFATTESDISNMSQKLAGAGKTVGLSASEILGFSAALSSVGIEAEAGGTAFSKVFIQLAEAASQGNADIAAFTGNTVAGFQQLVKNNPSEAVLQFIESLGRVKESGGDLFGVLEQLDIKEVRLRNALLSTANAGDLVRRSVELSGKAFQDNSALVEESGKRFATTESQMQIMNNAFSNMQAAIGEAILPALRELSALLVPVIQSVTAWAKENPNLVKGLLAMAGVVAVGGALLAGIAAVTLAVGVIGAAGGPILIAVGAVTALVGAFVAFKDKAATVASSVKSGVTGAIDGMAKALANTATAAVNAVAGILERINNFLDTFPQQAFQSGVALVDSFAKGLASKAQAAVDAVSGMVGQVRDYLPFSPAKEGPLSDLDKSGEAFGQVLAEGIERGADQPVEAVKDLTERLHNQIDIRGNIPTRASSGQFQGAIERTGTGFLDGSDAALKSFVARTQDSFAQGVHIAEAGFNAMDQAADKFSTDVVEGDIKNLGDVFEGLKNIAVESIKTIVKEMLKLAIIKTITSGLTGAFGGGFGAAGSGGAGPFAGLSGQPGFAFAGGVDAIVGGRGGVDANFFPMHLSRGERLLVETPAQQREGRGGNMTVNIFNNAGVDVTQQERQTPNGRELTVMIDRRVRNVNRNEFGLPPKPGRTG